MSRFALGVVIAQKRNVILFTQKMFIKGIATNDLNKFRQTSIYFLVSYLSSEFPTYHVGKN